MIWKTQAYVTGWIRMDRTLGNSKKKKNMLRFFREKRTGVTTEEEAKTGRHGACGFAGLRAPNLQGMDVASGKQSKGVNTVVQAGNYGVALSPSTSEEVRGFASVFPNIVDSARATGRLIQQHPVAGIVNAGTRSRVMPTPEHGLTPSEQSNYAVYWMRNRDDDIAAGKIKKVQKDDEKVRNSLMNGVYGNPLDWMDKPSGLPVSVSTGPTAIEGNQLIHTPLAMEQDVASPAGDALDQYQSNMRAHVEANLEAKVITGHKISLDTLDKIVDGWNRTGAENRMLWFFFHQPDGRVRVYGRHAANLEQFDMHSEDDLHTTVPVLMQHNSDCIRAYARPGDSVTCYPSAMVNHWLKRRYDLESEFHQMMQHRVASAEMLPGAAGLHALSGAMLSGNETFNPAIHVATIAESLASHSGDSMENANAAAQTVFGKAASKVVSTAGRISGAVGDVPVAVFGGLSKAAQWYTSGAEESNRKSWAKFYENQQNEEAKKAAKEAKKAAKAANKKPATRSGDPLIMPDGRPMHPSYTMLMVMDGYRGKEETTWGSRKHNVFLATILGADAAASMKKAIKKMTNKRMKSSGLPSMKSRDSTLIVQAYVPTISDRMIGMAFLPTLDGFDLNQPVGRFYQIGYWVYSEKPTKVMYLGKEVTISFEKRIWFNHYIIVKEDGSVDHFMSWTEAPGQDCEKGSYCNAMKGDDAVGVYYTSRKTSKKGIEMDAGKLWKSTEVTMFIMNLPQSN